MNQHDSSRAFARVVTWVAPFAVSLIASATLAADLTPQEKALIDAAKKEGSVTILNQKFSDSTGRRLAEGFVQKYDLGPNFRFNNLRKGSGAVIAQVRQEIMAGKHTVDVVLVPAAGFYDEASKRGAFEPIDSGYWKNHEEGAKAAGQYTNYPYVVVPYAFSFQPIWNAACPGFENFSVSSYADVLGPALKGKTIATDITKSTSFAETALGIAESGVDINDLFAKLKATDPVIEFRTEPKMGMVLSCQRPIDMWNLTGHAQQEIAKDPKLKNKLRWGTYKEGQVMLGSQVAVLKGAPSPNAAKLFIEYLLSKEGADVVVSGEAMYSFMEGYVPPNDVKDYLFDTNTTKLIGLDDWASAEERYKPLRVEWEKTFR